MTARAVALLWPCALALAVAVAWPLSAQAVHPLAMPALLGAAAVAAVISARPDLGIVAVLLLAPFTNAAVGGGRPVRFLESGLAVALLVYALLVERRTERGTESASSGLALPIGLFAGAAAVTSLLALDPGKSITRFLGVAAATALFFAVIEICRTRAQLLTVIGGAVGSLLVAGAFGVAQKVTGHTSYAGVIIDGEVVGRVAGTFSHPNQYAGYMIVLMPLAAALLATTRASPRLRAFAGVALAAALAALAFSYTRGAIVGLVGGVLVWLAVVRPRSAVAVAVVVAVGGVLLAPSALKERLREPAGGDIGLRADLWQSALDIYRTHPVAGVGLGNFGDGYARLPSQLSSGTQRRLLHQSQLLVPPHANNLFLTILAEQGIIGALAFLGLMGAALAVCLRACKLEDPIGRALGIGLGAGLCAMLIHSLLDYALFGEMSLPIFALLGVVAAFVARERANRPQATGSPT